MLALWIKMHCGFYFDYLWPAVSRRKTKWRLSYRLWWLHFWTQIPRFMRHYSLNVLTQSGILTMRWVFKLALNCSFSSSEIFRKFNATSRMFCPTCRSAHFNLPFDEIALHVVCFVYFRKFQTTGLARSILFLIRRLTGILISLYWQKIILCFSRFCCHVKFKLG